MFIDIEMIRIFIGESARCGNRPAYEAIVEEARRRGMAGATVYRGAMGFGANSLIHTSKILRLSEDLPVVVEIIDVPERVRAFLPRVQAMLPEGTLAVSPGKAVFHLPLRVRDVMVSDVVSTAPDTPLVEVVDLFLGRAIKAVPVVEERKPVGVITGGDLMQRARLGLRLDIQRRIPQDLRDETLSAIKGEGLTARDVMTGPAVMVNIRASVPEAARIMADKGVKRLVVVDDGGELAGVISRVDVLGAYARATTLATALPGLPKALHSTAGEAMFRDVPSCLPSTPLRQVLDLILSTPLRRVVVTDESGVIEGIILDGDPLARFAREHNPGLFRSLARRLSGASAGDEEWQGTAGDVMHDEVLVVQESTPLGEVLGIVLHNKVRRLVVSDGKGHLLGMVDRDTILRMLGRP
ncbi:MAG: DUF190 domain-containing protein [Desulfovibrionaceae bacterium]|nr:DUF190 domain-containing protein [Desulfovibrionaceae bacterium]